MPCLYFICILYSKLSAIMTMEKQSFVQFMKLHNLTNKINVTAVKTNDIKQALEIYYQNHKFVKSFCLHETERFRKKADTTQSFSCPSCFQQPVWLVSNTDTTNSFPLLQVSSFMRDYQNRPLGRAQCTTRQLNKCTRTDERVTKHTLLCPFLLSLTH